VDEHVATEAGWARWAEAHRSNGDPAHDLRILAGRIRSRHEACSGLVDTTEVARWCAALEDIAAKIPKPRRRR